MTLHNGLRYVAVALVITGAALGAVEAKAQALVDYATAPPFVSDTVPPNIMLVYDNSGSMNALAYTGTFSNSSTYGGIFDQTECYNYQGTANKFVPDPAVNPASPPSTCGSSYPWSGNLLNFVTMRRVDVAKWVMIGGLCVGSRDANDLCSTIKSQDLGINDRTQTIDASLVTNLMPASLLSGVGTDVDFLQKGSEPALAGSFCVDNDSTYPTGTTCDSGDTSDSYSETQYWVRVDRSQPVGGVIQQVGDKARLGVMHYDPSSDSDGGPVVADIGSDITTIVATVEGIVFPGAGLAWTTLAETLYEAARYFAQITPAYDTGNYTYTVTSKDPYYFNAPQWAGTSQYVTCCNSFVIMFTDGESSKDTNIPGHDTVSDSCPVGTGLLCDYAHVVHGSHCTGSGCSGHRTDYGTGSHYLDDVAYWAHTTDLRQSTIPVINQFGKDLAGFQNLTLYTFFAFGSGSELLQSAAKAGGFEDLDGDGLGPNGANTPNLTQEWDRFDNVTGALGSDGVPDTYFESNNADTLRDRLMATIESIVQRSSAGSSVSVLASSSTGEGALYQSFFFPSTSEGLNLIKWTGYTRGLFLDAFGNLREDTNGDGKLVYDQDVIIRTRLDTATNEVLVDRFDDSDGNGLADGPAAPPTIGLKEVQGIWEAGKELALRNDTADPRKILTWLDANHDGDLSGAEEAAVPFTTTNATTLAPYLREEAAPSPYTADAIINFVRGCEPADCPEQAILRNRRLTVSGSLRVWKLGDAIHAQPILVGAPGQRYDVIYGDSSYTTFFNQYHDRRQVAYLGANDGMLHAFNAGYFFSGDDPGTSGTTEHGYFCKEPTANCPTGGTGKALGEELWAFIPQELLPHLKWLAQPDYKHVYYVDLTPKVTDVRIFCDAGGNVPSPCINGQTGAAHPNGWGTILMGGFRMGGSCEACAAGTGAPPMEVTADFDNNPGTPDEARKFYSAYFVLDITDPERDPKLLWSFSSPDLGLTTTRPSMLRVNPASSTTTDHADAKWYMVVGSGPTGYNGSIAQSGKLYAINLIDGPGAGNGSVETLTAETLDAFMGNPLSIDRDLDYRVDVTYMGSVIHDGSLPWRGKLYRLTMNACTVLPCSPNQWGIDDGSSNRVPTEIVDTFPSSGTLELGPIAATPAVAIDDSNKVWVFAGTGRYYDAVDKTNTDQQYVVGVKDSVLNSACTQTSRTNCHDNDVVDVSSAEICLLGVGTCGAGTNQVTGVAGATSFSSLIGLVAAKDGWYTTLPAPGERALSRPLVFGGLVLFTTFVPTNDPCASTGESFLYALYYRTGSAYSAPAIGTTPSGLNKIVNRSTSLGSGMASQAVVHIGKDSSGRKSTAYVQKSSGELTAIETQTVATVTSRFLTWYDRRG